MKLLPGLVAVLQPEAEHRRGNPTLVLELELPTHTMATVPHTVVEEALEVDLEAAVLQPGHLAHKPPMTLLLVLAVHQVPVLMPLLVVPEPLHMGPPAVLALQPSDMDPPLPHRLRTTIIAVQIINEATMLLRLATDTLHPHLALAVTPRRPVRQLQLQGPGLTVRPLLVLPTLQLPAHQDTRARELLGLVPMMLLLLLLCLLVVRCTTHLLLPLWEVCLRPLAPGHMGPTGMVVMMVDLDMKKALQALKSMVKRARFLSTIEDAVSGVVGPGMRSLFLRKHFKKNMEHSLVGWIGSGIPFIR